MDQKANKEDEIYEKIMKLKDGDNTDKLLAFDCIGILGNESSGESLENRLNIIEKMIKEHLEKK